VLGKVGIIAVIVLLNVAALLLGWALRKRRRRQSAQGR
jgi:hypothetical protein